MQRMLVGDPEPTPQRQELRLSMRQSPERSESGTRVGGKKQTSDCCAGVVQVGNTIRRQVDDKRSRWERKAGIALTLRNLPR